MTPLPIATKPQAPPVFYPSTDGEPLAETFVHLYAILTVLEVLKQYLSGQQATVLSNQFLYYIPGNPRARVAPDVMVIFNVEPGGRDHYKIWEEGAAPSVVFEMTSSSTQATDIGFKKQLYAQLGVQEYWLFDPKQEWQGQSLQGYTLVGEAYQAIPNFQSEVLGLRLAVADQLIHFYRLDTGAKLLAPAELKESLAETQEQLEVEQQKRAELETLLAQYRDRFGPLAP
ncbi:MAG: Uma2 family endonuclease [Prochlorothrix sp.]